MLVYDVDIKILGKTREIFSTLPFPQINHHRLDIVGRILVSGEITGREVFIEKVFF